MQQLPSLGKLPKLPKLPSLRQKIRRPRLPSMEDITERAEVPGTREDPLEKGAMQGVEGSLPERIIWRWLERERYTYWVQYIVGGGRGFLGGMNVDFIVLGLAAQPVALRVQGEYWHGPLHPDRQAIDDEQAARLRADGYLVCDLWEDEIYNAYSHGWLTDYILSKVP